MPTVDTTKRRLGQFFTRHNVWLRPHIKRHLESLLGSHSVCVDPFAGDGHLLALADEMGFEIHGHDIDPQICQSNGWGVPNDSLLNVVHHANAVVLTNPPYMAKNSAKRLGSAARHYFDTNRFPEISEGLFRVLDDLFKLAIEQTIQTYHESVWIVPESVIQDLNELPHWREKLHSITILEDNPFSDTEHPVCVMIFSTSNPIQQVWKNDTVLGTYGQIRALHDQTASTANNAIAMRFNVPEGVLGYRAVDGTKTDNSMRIKFCRGDSLGYARDKIKVSSRHLTYIEVDMDEDMLDKVISEANQSIEAYRSATHDVFLTAFMGNTKNGIRRRRLDYKLARRIFNASYQKCRLLP